MSTDPVADLHALALQQHGCFTWAQAADLGWTTAAAHVARRTGAWLRHSRGVHVLRDLWEGYDERQRHLCLAHGRVLARAPGWHAARRTAAVVHDLPLLGRYPTVPQLVSAPATQRARASSRHERLATLPADDSVVVDGLAVTSLARTVVDVAREETFRSAVVVADGALRAGATSEQLGAVLDRCREWPGARRAQDAIAFADGLAESALESISRVACHEVGLPAPELQVEVWLDGVRLARLDFLWRGTRTAGLADGALKYATREDVIAEKRQVERLEDLGLEVVRWGWDLAYRPQGLFAERLRRGMARGARQDLDPRLRFVRTTVAGNLVANARLAARRSV